jgi:hypothetical protein
VEQSASRVREMTHQVRHPVGYGLKHRFDRDSFRL